MNSFCTRRFWETYHALPEQVRSVADKNYRLWTQNPKHPSLRFKPIGKGFWSIRAGKHYRALGYVEDDEVTWVWIGHHSEYDRLIGSLKPPPKRRKS